MIFFSNMRVAFMIKRWCEGQNSTLSLDLLQKTLNQFILQQTYEPQIMNLNIKSMFILFIYLYKWSHV